ncbi:MULTISPECIES: 5-formyltetrahydrofolate cyclo-ligase [Sphingobacterium]|uniref:5-formyltetrahydrofolate cyclo-ligase n=1 Tax=Sphingobacterium TaxID=28453 RepID=UPI0013DD158C|nr:MULTISPECIES: 5-formyltetrahydrofolate cyclo-ligase [unclassified Sphingobacterium]
MNKSELRLLYREKRKMLDRETRATYDDVILSHLKAMDWSSVHLLHLYIPIDSLNEPDTLAFMKWLKEEKDNVQFVVSRSDFASGEMIHFLWDESMVFEANKWGILEPKEGIEVNELDLDAVLVPLLVVDKEGNRVGYGKGFYDRFLARCNPEILSVGLSYFEPVMEISDVGKWDVKLRYCVNPQGVYRF